MATRIGYSVPFRKEFKRRARRYSQVVTEVAALAAQLERDERPGDKIPHVGYDVYKVRLKNPSAGRGKSGGFRVIYYIHLADYVLLVTIYSKSEYDDMTTDRLRRIIEESIPDGDKNDEAD